MITKQLSIFITFLLATYVNAQTNAISGCWKTPKSNSPRQYDFTDNKVTYHLYNCTSTHTMKGNYRISNDSIFIAYDSLTILEKKIYHLTHQPVLKDTLVIMNNHKIKINASLFVYNFDLHPMFSLQDSLFYKGQIYSCKIIFDLGKPSVNSTSFIYLDSIVDLLTKHHKLIIEIGNHNDSRGNSMKSSTNLTLLRAKNVASYLISKGITSNRLLYKGYGESKLVIPNYEIAKMKTKDAIEKAHSKNRRTEFKVLEAD